MRQQASAPARGGPGTMRHLTAALFGLSLHALARHYVQASDHMRSLGPIRISDEARRYAEMVVAIGLYRFGYEFTKAAQAAGWDERAGPVIEGVAKTVSYKGAA